MKSSAIFRRVLWLIGTVVVGALGSALWEVGKPILYGMSKTALDIATLGLLSLRDGMYEEVARGSYERAAEKIFSLLVGFIGGLLFILILRRPIVQRFLGRGAQDQNGDKEFMNSISGGLAAGIWTRRPSWLGLSILLAILVTLSIQSIRLIYVGRAANHIEQLQKVVAPFVDEKRRLLIASRFSAMHTRDEYVALQLELAEIARKNKVRVPNFDIY